MKCVPLVKSRLERSGPPWNLARLSKLRNRKSRLFKKIGGSGTDIDYTFIPGRVYKSILL